MSKNFSLKTIKTGKKQTAKQVGMNKKLNIIGGTMNDKSVSVKFKKQKHCKTEIRIRQAMATKGMFELSQLAEKVGISISALSQIVNEKRAGYSSRVKIARVLGTTVKDIFGGN